MSSAPIKTLGQQYADQWARARDQLAKLKQLTADNPRQQAQIAELQRAFDARGKELSETALYSAYKRHSDAWGSYYQVSDSEARQHVETMLQRVVELSAASCGRADPAAPT
jgi:CHASE3 domain sensor protein